MNIRLSVPMVAVLLFCPRENAAAQYSAYLSPTFGWYAVGGSLGSYLSYGPLVGLDVLDPHGHFELGIGGEYGRVGLDHEAAPGEFTRVALYGTGRWLPGGHGGTKRRLVPFLPARIGWTRFSGDSVPAPIRATRSSCTVGGVPVPCSYADPRQSGLELAGGAGLTFETGSRFAVEVTALVSLLELGKMRYNDYRAYGDKVEGAPLRGTGLTLRLTGRAGL